MNSPAAHCRRALQDAGIGFGADADGNLRVPSVTEEVGDLVLGFEGDEITAHIGRFTHRHFTPGACGDTGAADTEAECARVAVDFVREVVCDRWVLWTYPNGVGGCYRPGGDDEQGADAPLEGEDASLFVWSGPYDP